MNFLTFFRALCIPIFPEFASKPVALLAGWISIPALVLPVLMVGVRFFAEGQDMDRLRLNLVGMAAGVLMKVRIA